MKRLVLALLGQRSQWFAENVFFISWGKHWKGIYLHFLPLYMIRLFLWGADARRKNGGLAGCRLTMTLLVLFAAAAPALAGWQYSPTYRSGYTYYGHSCGYAAGYYYYQPTYYQPTYYYPPYTVSYNPDSAKQLEIIQEAMRALIATNKANQGGSPSVPAAALRDGPSILGARCANCHAASKVEAKGSKLTLLKDDGKVAELSLVEKRNVVKRVYEIDPSKCMPPGKPLVEDERAALAEYLGVQVIQGK